MSKLIADLHIHSHYSRATSKDLTFEQLARWAQLKGVQVVGAGDIAHPGWLQEMHDKLEPAEEGLFRLKADVAASVQASVPLACQGTVRFLLAGEISNIYKRHGAVRKVHNVIFAPTLERVERIQQALEKIGNIRSDGRPILGLDSRDLLEIILEIDSRCCLIPAHIWTPWFSMLGSKSGFDSVEECFGDLTSHIFALETGLSSDPPMNWRVANLDGYRLVSNSDAHSPQKLAREATIFYCEWGYDALFDALRSGDPQQYGGTIEFFPEEGKYHLDGHRKCGIRWEPPETIAHQRICPVCGREVTVGVMHRVEELAGRAAGEKPPQTHPFYHLIPLPEVLGELLGVGASSRRVQQEYANLLAQLGPELAILLDLPEPEIAAAGGARLAAAIMRMRRGEVVAEGGYDGEYGVVKLFHVTTEPSKGPQLGLFGEDAPANSPGQGDIEKNDIEKNDTEKNDTEKNDTEKNDTEKSGVEPRNTDPHDVDRHTIEPGHVDQIAGEAYLLPTPAAQPTLRESPASWSAASLFDPPDAPIDADANRADDAGRAAAPAEADWMARLNTEQRAAVECVDAHLLIVAGPGTGKTRTLTVRIAHLIQQQHVSPAAILAITFTNKAAGEMAGRLADLVGSEVAGAFTVKTFHAFGAQLLHSYGAALGLPGSFAIAGEAERRTVLHSACPELDGQELDGLLDAISRAKNQLLAPNDPALALLYPQLPGLPTCYQRYNAALAAVHSLDFDDLVGQAVRLLEEIPEALQAVHARYRWISVDEYQDVNLAQYRLLRLLTGGGANLCAIGDPQQAIYSFRGAESRFFLDFAQDYPGARQLHLRQSYRSPQSLLDAAGQVIARNHHDIQVAPALQLWSDFTAAVQIDIQVTPTDRAEAETVLHRIEQMVGGTSHFSLDSGRVDDEAAGVHSFGDFAVLYRLNAQGTLLVEAFERSGIPYQALGQASLAAAREVREVLAALWLLQTPQAHAHLATLLGAGGGAFAPPALAEVIAQRADLPLAQGLAQAAAAPQLSRGRQRVVAQLAAAWPALAAAYPHSPVSQLVALAQQLVAGLRGQPFSTAQAERLAQLQLRATSYGTALGPFLENMLLQSEADAYDPRADRVTLMSLHASKGLEFPVVFVVGCEEGLLPYTLTQKPVDLSEERRLFYVGMTRAQQKLILTHARSRFLFGQQLELPVSPFVDDIEAALKAVQAMTQLSRRPQKEKPGDLQLPLL
jgi:DNA helicase II / ATP-dependent DNA helicase PcrA